MYEDNFWTFVTTAHSPTLHRRLPRPRTEVSIKCACGKQTPWRKEAHRLRTQQDWVGHVHDEREIHALPSAAGL